MLKKGSGKVPFIQPPLSLSYNPLKTPLEHLYHPFVAFRDLPGIQRFPSPSLPGVTLGEVKHPRSCQKGRKAAGKSELCCNMKIKCKAQGVFLAALGCTGV